MQIAKVQNEEHKVVLVHISSILRKPRKCLFTYLCVYLQNKAVISSDNYWLITIGNYRSVPLIRPPILYTTSSLKRGEGLYSNMQLVSNISPPPPPPPPKKKKKKFYAIAT